MKTTEIKKSTPMLWVEIAFWVDKEILYFEWTLQSFSEKLQNDFVYFPLYHRTILSSKIKEFWEVKNEEIKTREQKISSLTEKQKEEVKFFVSQMKKNIWREPTDKEFEKMIFRAVHWYLPENKPWKDENRLGEYWRKKTIAVIQKIRENKKKFWKYVINNF